MDVHPTGLASAASHEDLGISLEHEAPDYGGVAKAAANNQLWTTKVTKAADLENALETAIHVVAIEKKSALLDVLVS